MRLWPFGRKPKQEHYLGEYTEPSFRGALTMLTISVVVIVVLWVAYSWALNQSGIHDPNRAIDRVTATIGILAIR